MKFKYLSLLVCLVISHVINGQYGFIIESGPSYYSLPAKGHNYNINNSLHFGLGPSYWFRIKPRRIEFNPAVLINYNKTNNLSNALSLRELQLKLGIPIMLYPMDFRNDCNCPTFNKQGQLFKKGFHFIFNPAIALNNQTFETTADPITILDYNLLLGLGAGIDIGLNKTWTISPSIVISRSFQDQFLIDANQKIENEISQKRYQADLMIRFLWYTRKKRY